jgi:uncharacterized protein (TIGR03067 family)
MITKTDGVLLKGDLRIDASKKPAHIDVDLGAERGLGKGIFELKGGTLKMCLGGGGNDRPADFSSPKGSNIELVVLNRLADDKEAKKSKLDGTWVEVSAIRDGKEENLKHVLTIEGTKFTVKGAFDSSKGTLKVNYEKKPHELDWTFTEGEDVKGKTIKCIFEIKGDTLRFCAAMPGNDERPTEFTAAAGSNRFMVTLKRPKD